MSRPGDERGNTAAPMADKFSSGKASRRVRRDLPHREKLLEQAIAADAVGTRCVESFNVSCRPLGGLRVSINAPQEFLEILVWQMRISHSRENVVDLLGRSAHAHGSLIVCEPPKRGHGFTG